VFSRTGCHYAGASRFVPFAFEGDITGSSATIRITYASPCGGTAEGSGSINAAPGRMTML
jgi:hypothetical protein